MALYVTGIVAVADVSCKIQLRIHYPATTITRFWLLSESLLPTHSGRSTTT